MACRPSYVLCSHQNVILAFVIYFKGKLYGAITHSVDPYIFMCSIQFRCKNLKGTRPSAAVRHATQSQLKIKLHLKQVFSARDLAVKNVEMFLHQVLALQIVH